MLKVLYQCSNFLKSLQKSEILHRRFPFSITLDFYQWKGPNKRKRGALLGEARSKLLSLLQSMLQIARSILSCLTAIFSKTKQLTQFYNKCFNVKGELRRQNKLIPSERPFKILQNKTKIIKIGWAVLEIFNFKDLGSFPRKSDRKPKMLSF